MIDSELEMIRGLHELAKVQADTIEILTAQVLSLSLRVDLLEKGE